MQWFQIYWRKFFKSKTLSLINLFGLTLGISCCIFIFLFVTDEMGYDSHQKNLSTIYRISTKFTSEASIDHVAISSFPLKDVLKRDFPEVRDAARFINIGDEHKAVIKKNDNLIVESEVFSTEPEAFGIFTFDVISGDLKKALALPNSVVLTNSIAKKYFDQEDPVGKTLNINQKDHMVTAVIGDIPQNSDFKFTMLTTIDSTKDSNPWFDFSYYTYVMFDEKAVQSPDFVRDFEKKLNILADDKINRPLRENDQTVSASLHIQPLEGMHFQEPLLYDTPKGNKTYVYVFSLVALLILFIGCLNYINFSIVQSFRRSKEVGIRKVVGATFRQLVVHYIGESFLTTLIAFFIALIVVALLIPFFNEVTDKHFTLYHLVDFRIFSAMAVVLVAVGLLAGSYPAFYSSSIKVVQALKGKLSTPRGQLIRKVSVTTQFIISIGLILCTVMIFNQMKFIENFDTGFKKNNVLVLATPDDSASYPKFKVLKEKFLTLSGVESAALGGYGALPSSPLQRGSINIKAQGKDQIRMVNFAHVDEDYLRTLQIDLRSGRNYNGKPEDWKNSVIINESFARMMGWKNPMEQKIRWHETYCDVIGVVNDFHYLSLREKVEPQVIVHHDNKITHVFITLDPRQKDAVSLIGEEWIRNFPDAPFRPEFLDERINAQYKKEEKARQVFTYFSILTVVISCLGLFGLSSLTIYQRKKEIGIRKVIGASFRSIFLLFSKEYLVLIIVAITIVSPVSWYIMERWLESFTYKAGLQVYIFFSVGVGIVGLSLITILLSILKISSSRPADLMGE